MATYSKCITTTELFSPKDVAELESEIKRVGGNGNAAAIAAAKAIIERAQQMRTLIMDAAGMVQEAPATEAAAPVEEEDITASNRRVPIIGRNTTLPATTGFDAVRIKLQDDALRMRRVLDAVKAKGGKVTEAQNFYDANTLMPGRIQAAVDDFRVDVLRPMTERAIKADIEMDELAIYAYAKHAAERNAYIASINPRLPDGGSGMTNADAAAILQRVAQSGKQAEYDALHKDLMSITSTTRQLMLNEGLITQDEFDAMDGAYEFYIPLRGWENVVE
jgi:hypothetical protein